MRAHALHLCSTCGSPLVQAESWTQPEANRWEIQLRCPECSRVDTSSFTRAEFEAFLDERDRAAAELHRLAEQLDRERFAMQVELFAEALQAGAVEPMDF